MKTAFFTPQSTLMALLTLSWALSPADAQTAPDLTVPDITVPDITAPVAATDDVVLDAGFDNETTGITSSQAADTIAIARGEGEWKSGSGALNWNYTLGETAPRLSIDATAVGANASPSIKLDGAHSVRFALKTSAPAAIAIFFEEAQSPDAKNEPVRYVATVWSAGGAWTEYELSRDRFAPEVSAADEAAAALPVIDWTHIGRFGVQDVTNAWLKAAGQVQQKGARRLWLDVFRAGTGEAANAPLAAIIANPAPQPAAPPAEAPGEAAAPPDNDAVVPGEGGMDADVEGEAPADDQLGNDQMDGGTETEALAAPPLRVNQDDRGDARLWIPINATTEAIAGGGLRWNYIRLANRVSALIAPVNPLWMKQFPLASVRTGEKTPQKLLLLFEFTTKQPTRFNIAVVERDGATYSKTLAVQPRAFRQRLSVALSDLQVEGTRPDKNGQIDLDRIQSIVFSDVAAQKGVAGPNSVTLFGAAWMY